MKSKLETILEVSEMIDPTTMHFGTQNFQYNEGPLRGGKTYRNKKGAVDNYDAETVKLSSLVDSSEDVFASSRK